MATLIIQVRFLQSRQRVFTPHPRLLIRTDNDVGPKLQLDLYNVSFTPTGNVDFISDQWGKLEATGDCLAAVSGPNVGRFGLVTVLNVAPGP
jgi:hypothetical protein